MKITIQLPALVAALVVAMCSIMNSGEAQAVDPTVVDPTLAVRKVVDGLNQPTSMAFLGSNDILVLEKATGKVQRVVNGDIQSTVLDLAVNSASERGLLGIALHPQFPANPRVYLYWTESTTGADTTVLSETPLLGNRVDRLVWNGSTLTFDQNLIHLRALHPPRPRSRLLVATTTGACCGLGPTASSTSSSAMSDAVGSCRTSPMAPSGQGSLTMHSAGLNPTTRISPGSS